MRKIFVILLAAAFAGAFSFCSKENSGTSAPINISQVSVLEVAPVQKTTAAFMKIKNNSSDEDFLIGAETEMAEVCEIHEMVMEGEMMRMRKLDSVEIPGGDEVFLKRGGLHLMLINLKREIHEGESIKIRLKFKNSEDVEIEAPVKSFDSIQEGGDHGSH